MGMQVPYPLDTQMPEKTAIWPTSEKPWRRVTRSGLAKGEPDAGRIPTARQCAYADLHPAQVCGGPGGGIYEK